MGFEWYTLDSNLKRSHLIEGFGSFIWTERYTRTGDIQIITPSTKDSRALLKPGLRLAMNQSFRVMTIDTVLDETADDGTRNLTITGPSIEDIFNHRVGMPALASLTATPTWTLSGTPGAIMRAMFQQVCVTGGESASDTVPFYTAGTLLPAGSIPEPTGVITITFQPDTLYNDLVAVGDMYALGFRLVKNGDAGQIYFEVYTGTDRTSRQTVNHPVIFARNMETLDDIKVLNSSAPLKTVAYVFAQNGVATVYAPGYDSSYTGTDRRVLLVDASDIDLAAGPLLNAAMQQRGLQELAKNQRVYSFDGQISAVNPYVYGVDYNLGDLVEERDSDGNLNSMFVIEQIFASDANGERSYPTLALNQTIPAGTWLAVPASRHWLDEDPAIHWLDL
jgi:Siphovirus ReqiPepy6 Gp37-like protein